MLPLDVNNFFSCGRKSPISNFSEHVSAVSWKEIRGKGFFENFMFLPGWNDTFPDKNLSVRLWHFLCSPRNTIDSGIFLRSIWWQGWIHTAFKCRNLPAVCLGNEKNCSWRLTRMIFTTSFARLLFIQKMMWVARWRRRAAKELAICIQIIELQVYAGSWWHNHDP